MYFFPLPYPYFGGWGRCFFFGNHGGDSAVDTAATQPDTAEPSCGYTGTYLIPGPCEEGHDAELALKARRYERTWVTFHTAAHGASVDLGVSDPDDRALIDAVEERLGVAS